MTNGRVENIDIWFRLNEIIDLIFHTDNMTGLKTFHFLHKMCTFLFQLHLVYYILVVLAIIF